MARQQHPEDFKGQGAKAPEPNALQSEALALMQADVTPPLSKKALLNEFKHEAMAETISGTWGEKTKEFLHFAFELFAARKGADATSVLKHMEDLAYGMNKELKEEGSKNRVKIGCATTSGGNHPKGGESEIFMFLELQGKKPDHESWSGMINPGYHDTSTRIKAGMIHGVPTIKFPVN